MHLLTATKRNGQNHCMCIYLGVRKITQSTNIVPCCYNKSSINSESSIMQPGNYPNSLFKTWLDYRIEHLGQTRADVIREVNEKLDRKYDNDRFYKWLKTVMTVAEPVVIHFIEPELPDVLQWYFEKNNLNTKGIDFKELAEIVTPSIKNIRT